MLVVKEIIPDMTMKLPEEIGENVEFGDGFEDEVRGLMAVRGVQGM